MAAMPAPPTRLILGCADAAPPVKVAMGGEVPLTTELGLVTAVDATMGAAGLLVEEEGTVPALLGWTMMGLLLLVVGALFGGEGWVSGG
jgi:hypothetical protein